MRCVGMRPPPPPSLPSGQVFLTMAPLGHRLELGMLLGQQGWDGVTQSSESETRRFNVSATHQFQVPSTSRRRSSLRTSNSLNSGASQLSRDVKRAVPRRAAALLALSARRAALRLLPTAGDAPQVEDCCARAEVALVHLGGALGEASALATRVIPAIGSTRRVEFHHAYLGRGRSRL